MQAARCRIEGVLARVPVQRVCKQLRPMVWQWLACGGYAVVQRVGWGARVEACVAWSDSHGLLHRPERRRRRLRPPVPAWQSMRGGVGATGVCLAAVDADADGLVLSLCG